MSEPIIEYRDEFNVMDFVSKYAERISRVIDEQTLANVEHHVVVILLGCAALVKFLVCYLVGA